MKRIRKTRSITICAKPELYEQIALLAKKVNPLLSTHRAHLELLQMAMAMVEERPELLRERLGL